MTVLNDEAVADWPLGSLEEAQELYDSIGMRSYTATRGPDGWTFLGRGGTRAAWLAPSGVVYKVCHRYYDDDSRSSNEVEHENFKLIRKSGRLKEGWKVPKSYLHRFTRVREQWSYVHDKQVMSERSITIIAVEHVDGSTWHTSYEAEMEQAMNAVGLTDAFSGNAMLALDGTKWIVDAAEKLLDPIEVGSNE